MSRAKKVISLLSAASVAAVVSAAVFAVDLDQAVKDRIAPIGNVCMSGDDCAAAPVAAAPAEPRTGAQVVKASCNTCHAGGIGGAPKIGDAADWGARVSKGIDVLYGSAINGFQDKGMMPARGTCANCSDDELKAAVDHMLEKSK